MSKKLSFDVDLATATHHYGLIEELVHDVDLISFYEDGYGHQIIEDGIPLTKYELLERSVIFSGQEHPHILYTHYVSPDCVLNTMIRTIAGLVGEKYINADVIPYWKKTLFELGFWEKYAKYFDAISLEESDTDRELRLSDGLRPKVILTKVSEAPLVTMDEVMNDKSILASLELIEGVTLKIITDVEIELYNVVEQGKGTFPLICRSCCVTEFTLEPTEDLFGFCAKCGK